jgi:hypothetical protein
MGWNAVPGSASASTWTVQAAAAFDRAFTSNGSEAAASPPQATARPGAPATMAGSSLNET